MVKDDIPSSVLDELHKPHDIGQISLFIRTQINSDKCLNDYYIYTNTNVN